MICAAMGRKDADRGCKALPGEIDALNQVLGLQSSPFRCYGEEKAEDMLCGPKGLGRIGPSVGPLPLPGLLLGECCNRRGNGGVD